MSLIIDLTEMEKLREMLNNKGIEWSDNTVYYERTFLARTLGDGFSVICGNHSIGGNRGLLEVWTVIMEDPEGYCTAEECMAYIIDVTK